MELTKIYEEASKHLLGDPKFRWFRRRDIDAGGFRRELAEFLRDYPYEKTRRLSLEFKRRSHSEDVALIAAGVEHAAERRQGFSFLRMGDGEGRFVGLARTYRHLYDQSKRIANNVWYKYSDPPDESFYDSLETAYKNASIVGYVPAYRLELEAPNVWYGYFGCVCGNEFIHESIGKDIVANERRLVRNWANVHLIERDVLLPVLKRSRVGFVTCHADPTPFLKRFGLHGAEHIVIAPEATPLIDNRSERQKFYPDHFREILERLVRSDTQIYLIGAGVFAKVFCERLRAAGKIGLDIGSVLDQIAGVATRPASLRESEYRRLQSAQP